MRLPRRLTLGLRAWMLVVSALAALPLLAFSAYTVHRLVDGYDRDAEAALQQRTTAAARAVKLRLERSVAALQALALSRSARGGDIAALHANALHVLGANPDAVEISLSRANGEQVFTTLRPLGHPSRRPGAAAHERGVFEQGQVAYTPVHAEALTGRLVMSVSVPVVVDGRIEYALRMSLPSEAFAQVLHGQQWPLPWVGVLADSQGLIAARTVESDRYAGTPISDSLRQAIAQGRGEVFTGRTKDGTAVRAAMAEVPGTGWRVVVGVPEQAVRQVLRATLRDLALVGLACAAIGALAALFVARFVTGQIDALVRASTAGPVPAPGPRVRGAVRELRLVNDALSAVHTRERAMSQRLMHARHDDLTALPRRGLFREAAQALAQRAAQAGDSIALLYLDLDGFKQINDRLGHDAGDAALRGVADAIRSAIRSADIAGRLGGDEFVVCVSGPASTLPETCRSVTARLLGAIGDVGHGLGCSIGIVLGAADAASIDTMMTQADEALREAKRQGKNRAVHAA